MSELNRRIVRLISDEGESFDVTMSVAKMSELVATMIDKELESEETQEIPVSNISLDLLAKVIEFAEHYQTDPMPEIEKVRRYFQIQICLQIDSIQYYNLLFLFLSSFLSLITTSI